MRSLIIGLIFLISYNLANAQVKVLGTLEPNNPSDTYATHDAKYGKGGLISVSTWQERNAITPERRSQGMLVRVKSATVDSTYTLGVGLTNADWEVYATGGGTIPEIPGLQDSLNNKVNKSGDTMDGTLAITGLGNTYTTMIYDNHISLRKGGSPLRTTNIYQSESNSTSNGSQRFILPWKGNNAVDTFLLKSDLPAPVTIPVTSVFGRTGDVVITPSDLNMVGNRQVLITDAGGNFASVPLGGSVAVNGSIPMYTTDGVLRVGNGVIPEDAVNKLQLDSLGNAKANTNGSNATGTWGIDISGNANRASYLWDIGSGNDNLKVVNIGGNLRTHGGTPLNLLGNASGATHWGGAPADFSQQASEISSIAVYDGSRAKYNYAIPSQLGTALNINNGSTLNNNISGNAGSATLWGGVTADFSTFGDTFDQFVGRNSSGQVKPFTPAQAQIALGLGSAAYLNVNQNPLNGDIVQRTLDGDIKGRYFSMEGGVEGTAINSIVGVNSTDGYLRRYTVGSLRDFLSIPSGGETLQSVINRNRKVNNGEYILFNPPTGDTPTFGIRSTTDNNLELTASNIGNILLSGGNVGIGTTTPSAKLDVNGNVNISGTQDVSGNITSNNTISATNGFITNSNYTVGTGGKLSFQNLIGDEGYKLSYTTGDNSLRFNNGSDRLLLASSGNIGIGITNPTSKLHVAGSITGTYLNGTQIEIGGSSNEDALLHLTRNDNQGDAVIRIKDSELGGTTVIKYRGEDPDTQLNIRDGVSGDIAVVSDIPTNYLTTNTNQVNITGAKTWKATTNGTPLIAVDYTNGLKHNYFTATPSSSSSTYTDDDSGMNVMARSLANVNGANQITQYDSGSGVNSTNIASSISGSQLALSNEIGGYRTATLLTTGSNSFLTLSNEDTGDYIQMNQDKLSFTKEFGTTNVSLSIASNTGSQATYNLPTDEGNGTLATREYAGKMFTYTTSGDGTTSQFSVPHGLSYTPTMVLVTPNSSDAMGKIVSGPININVNSFWASVDASNITINFVQAPVSGTDNLTWTIWVK